MDLRKYLGNQIRFFREQAGISQELLGEGIGVSKQTIYRVEKGLAWPEYENLEAIGARLKVAPERFFAALSDVKSETSPQEALAVLQRFVEAALRTQAPPVRAAEPTGDPLAGLSPAGREKMLALIEFEKEAEKGPAEREKKRS